MTNKITLERQLNDYYEREDISPQNFSVVIRIAVKVTVNQESSNHERKE